MQSNFVRVYLGELQNQCEFAMSAIRSLNSALSIVMEGHPEPERLQFANREVFRAIHSFLTHASNVSRILWPPQSARRANRATQKPASRVEGVDAVQRGTALRAAISISDTSSLRHRTLRDHLEHFDERLDQWRESSQRRMLVNDFIGSVSLIHGVEATDVLRTFDPESNLFVFRGEAFDLQELATEVGRAHANATSALAALQSSPEPGMRGR